MNSEKHYLLIVDLASLWLASLWLASLWLANIPVTFQSLIMIVPYFLAILSRRFMKCVFSFQPH
ncbi:MAG: hypothetical protein F6K40_19375 [Okeania sp. SIO3I5]|uniref:hypothetical protein n=1 Tax=Okeania sp. SIO3I5 TaxID=2607805 RepID=UPI0013B60EAB|nr:hypothetical protein [Okeania sp. SIO3I5]NEQ38306.1 hypothetical protein [Okeania sp. SIO3I5]